MSKLSERLRVEKLNLHLKRLNQSKPIYEWANRCSYHKKIALVKPFPQSQQIDLSRDSELSLQRNRKSVKSEAQILEILVVSSDE